MKPAPRQIVNTRFGGREALVTQLVEMLGDDADDRASARLRAARNRQLIRLHEVLTEVRERFGSKEALVQSVAKGKFDGRTPDSAYVDKLRGYTSKRLLDLHRQVGEA